MKKRLTIGIAVIALAATVTSLTAAGLRYREQAAAVDESPRYGAGARIIHVPQPRARGEQAGSYRYDEAAVPADGNDENVAPPPRRRAIQRSQRSDPPPPPAPPRVRSEPKRVLGPPRNVLGAPQAATQLTPIYPTPKFDAKLYSGDKFAAPETNAATMAPPPGYTPPRAPRDKN